MPYRVPKHLLSARAAFQDYEKNRIQGLAGQRRHRLPLPAEEAVVTPDTAQERMEKLAEARWQSNFLSTRLVFNELVRDANRADAVLNQLLENGPDQRRELPTAFANELTSEAAEMIMESPCISLPRSFMRHLLGKNAPSPQKCLEQDIGDCRLLEMQLRISDLQVTGPVTVAMCELLLDDKQEKVATASAPAQKVPLLPLPPRA